MDPFHDDEIIKLKELLRHTGEFIAYFELAESKMISWRQDIDQRFELQGNNFLAQFEHIQKSLDTLQELLSEAGIARFRVHLEDALKKGEQHLALLHHTAEEAVACINAGHQAFTSLVANNIAELKEHTSQSLQAIDDRLNQYDIELFKKVANNSCDQVEKVATFTIKKSANLLRNFQWRAFALAFGVTLFTVFSIGMYINNELPWEIHKHVVNEREAGRALLKAWPKLTEEEKNKIMQTEG